MKTLFSKRIKELREGRDLMQKDLAEEFNISRTTISEWESGKNHPNVEMLIILADYFDVSADFLLGLDSINKIPQRPYSKMSDNKKRCYEVLDDIYIDNFSESEVSALINDIINSADMIRSERMNTLIQTQGYSGNNLNRPVTAHEDNYLVINKHGQKPPDKKIQPDEENPKTTPKK